MAKSWCYLAITRVWAKFETRVAHNGAVEESSVCVCLYSRTIPRRLRLPHSLLIVDGLLLLLLFSKAQGQGLFTLRRPISGLGDKCVCLQSSSAVAVVVDTGGTVCCFYFSFVAKYSPFFNRGNASGPLDEAFFFSLVPRRQCHSTVLCAAKAV